MKKRKVLSIILALALAFSGCTGGSGSTGAADGTAASGSETAAGAEQQGSAAEDGEPGEYTRAMAKKSQSSEDSDPTISRRTASEGDEGTKDGAEQNGRPEQKACTVMIYMVGSNLESRLGNATKDLEEIDGAGLNFDNYNVIVYTGGSTRWVGDVPCDRNCVLDMSLEGEDRIVAQTKANANMGLPETLSAFLNYCGENYPADHNVLILWDHGGGPLWGYGVDELYDSDSLLLNEMRAAMDGSVFRGGADGKKLDMVGFDACLMGSLECMTIWQDYAEYYVGSEELEPGDGWNYAFLKVLDEDGTYSGDGADTRDGAEPGDGAGTGDGAGSGGGSFAKAVGDSILSSFEEYYDGKRSATYNPDLTLACVDLGQINALNAAIDAMAEKMADDVEGGGYAGFMKDRSDIKSFGMTRDSEGSVSFFYDLVDVGNLVDHMETLYPQEAAAVREALGAAVAGKYANIDDSAGMTLYYPYKNKGQFEQLGEYYAGLLKTKGYSRFLQATREHFLRSKSWDWSLGEPKDSGDEYTLQLTHEQLDNMSEATYTVLIDNGTFGGYTPVMENCKIEPDKNGVLHLEKNVPIAVIKNGDSSEILRAAEVETDRKRKVYETKEISLRSDLLYHARIMDTEAADVTIRMSRDKKSGETQILNIELQDDASGISGGKNSVDLMNWEGLAILTGNDLLVPARDEQGRLRPYGEWIRPGSTTWKNVPVNRKAELEIVGIDDLFVEGAICQIEIRDVNGEKYAAETVPIGWNNRKKATVPVGSGSLEFAVLEDHAELTVYNGRETRIEVPDMVEGVPVTVIGKSAFSWLGVFDSMGYNPVTEVILPDTVTEIGPAAFAYCRDLRRINAPASLKEVGSEAFNSCLSLESFEMPDSVEKIGKCAFAYCTSLTQFRIPQELILMEEGAFMHCTMLEQFTGGTQAGGQPGGEKPSAESGGEEHPAESGGEEPSGSPGDAQSAGNFPVLAEDGAVYTGDGALLLAYPEAAGDSFAVKEGTQEIGYGAFDGASLVEVVLPESLTKIGNYAFYDCEHLKAPVFPEGITQLGMHCFDVEDWTFEPEEIPQEQEVIRIPASLEEIGDHAFDGFVNARFEVSEENRHYSAIGGALMNKAGDTIYYIATGPDFRAVYPEGTVEFKEDMLDVYAAVNYLTANAVRQIYLPASMTKFPEEISDYQNRDQYAIYHCPAGSEAEKFALRLGLQCINEMEWPEGTAELPTQKGALYFDMYSDHAVLKGYSGEDETIEIPGEVEGKAVTAVGNGAEPLFTTYALLYDTGRSAPALTKIVIPEGVTDLNSQALSQVNYGTEIALPSTLKKLGRDAINSSVVLNDLPEGIEILETNCIYWSADVPFVVTPKMRYIDGTFSYSVSAIEQEGDNDNYSVRDGVLYNADGSVLLRYPDGSTAEEFSIPEGTVSVGYRAFCEAQNLRKINLPGSLKQIGEQAFASCTGLAEITYEEDTVLETIGQAAFSSCLGLTEISLPPVKEIREYAFMSCESLTTVHFAEGTRSIGYSAFQNTAIAAPQFPDSLVKIGDYAYSNYEGQILEGSADTIRIPAGVSEIGTMAFGYVGNTAFEVDPGSTNFSSVDGLLLDRDKNALYLCPAGKKGTVAVPEGVTALMYGAFGTASGVTDVEIPDSVVYIESGNFDPVDVDDGNGGTGKVYPITIHCSKGSYAEEYAVSKSIPCEAK